MKNKKLLALALSTGLVLGGASNALAAEDPDALYNAQSEAYYELVLNDKLTPENEAKINNAKSVEEVNAIVKELVPTPDSESKNEGGQTNPENPADGATDNPTDNNDNAGNDEQSGEETPTEEQKLQEAKDKAKAELKEAGIESEFLLKGIDGAKTIEAVDNLKKEILESNKKSNQDINEAGFSNAEEAKKAAEKALKNDDVNNSYTVTKWNDGKFRYTLSPFVETKEEEKPAEEVKEEENKDSINDGQAKAIAEAEKHLANDPVNKGYNITVAGDGSYGIVYTVEPGKTLELNKKEVDPLLAGYESEAGAKEVAEALIANDPINNGYDIRIGADNNYYISLKVEANKKPDNKPTPDKKPDDKPTPDKKPDDKPTPDKKPEKEDPTPGIIIPGRKDDKKDEPKVEDPKVEEPKADEPKKDEPKAEDPKKDDKKDDKKDEKESDKKESDKKEADKKESPAKKSEKKSDNPKTGVASVSSLAGLAAISMAGIVASRKRK